MLDTVNMITTSARTYLGMVDFAVYYLLRYAYELFFNVATSNFLNGEIIFSVFSRIQLIIGIFMMFQLTMTIIKGIVNPDSFTDGKTGFGNIVTRIVISLTLLTLLVPLNIASPSNKYERHINNSGILFGTLYSLQERILSNNTIGRLIFGNDDTDYTSDSSDRTELESSANKFVSTVLKTFYVLNTNEDGDFVCSDGEDIEDAYNEEDVSPIYIILLGSQTCSTDEETSQSPLGILSIFGLSAFGVTGLGNVSNQVYVISLFPIIPGIVGIILVWLIFKLTFDVAVRVIKLAALQLMAPIPIVSYMDPKGSKDGAFSSWVKLLSTTYLDLFTHLAVIYFAMAIISKLIMEINLSIPSASETTGNIFSSTLLLKDTFVILVIAIFIFAKDAPKFFKQMLGIKGDGKFFSAFGDALGIGTSAFLSVGNAVAGARASRMADETRQAEGKKDIFGNNVDPNGSFNRAKHALVGIFGGVSGFTTGVGASLGAKDHKAKAAWDAMQKRNATALARGSDGSTILGRMSSSALTAFTGEGAAGATEREISTNKARIDALKAIQSRVKGEMVKSTHTVGKLGVVGADGRSARANYKDFMSRYEAAKTQQLNSFQYMNLTTGQLETIDMKTAEDQKGFLLKNNEDNYIKRMLGNYVPTAAEIQDGDRADNYSLSGNENQDNLFTTLVRNAKTLGASVEFSSDADGKLIKVRNTDITSRDSINTAIDNLTAYNVQLGQENAINKANDRYSGNKN